MKPAVVTLVTSSLASPIEDCKGSATSGQNWNSAYCKSMCEHYGGAVGQPWCLDQSSGAKIAECVVKNHPFCVVNSQPTPAPVPSTVPSPPTIPTAPPVPPTIPTAPPVPPTIPTAPPVPPTIPTAPPVPPTTPTAPPVTLPAGSYTEGLAQAHVNDGQPNIGACQFPDGAKYYEYAYHYQQLDCSKAKPCWSTFRKDHPVVKCGDCIEVVPHLDGVGWSESDKFYLKVVDNNYSHVDFEIDIRAWTPWCPGYCHGSGNCAKSNDNCPSPGDLWSGPGPLSAGFCGHMPADVCFNGIAATSQKIKWQVVSGCGTW
ncbi:MAG: uncharacterized protein KVP18_003345 [Porospora cf. gigantea A]|uniref:uncharacterized protein n=1 Tax=Porospora cf. gigantea A TaxID=2853593 RepID=UPI00355A9E36|nr:MAG: hypothetical protein KVP18_003345 [Porospora cf. gigantea A]